MLNVSELQTALCAFLKKHGLTECVYFRTLLVEQRPVLVAEIDAKGRIANLFFDIENKANWVLVDKLNDRVESWGWDYDLEGFPPYKLTFYPAGMTVRIV